MKILNHLIEYCNNQLRTVKEVHTSEWQKLANAIFDIQNNVASAGKSTDDDSIASLLDDIDYAASDIENLYRKVEDDYNQLKDESDYWFTATEKLIDLVENLGEVIIIDTKPTETTDIIDWCYDNINGVYGWTSSPDDLKLFFVFINTEDAMAFKLKWT